MANESFREKYNCPAIKRFVTISGTYREIEIDQSRTPVGRILVQFKCDHLAECPYGTSQPPTVEEKCPAYLAK